MFRFHQMSLTLISGMQQITSPEQLKHTMISASKVENKKPKIIASINEPGIQKVFKIIIQSDSKEHIWNGFRMARSCNFLSVNIHAGKLSKDGMRDGRSAVVNARGQLFRGLHQAILTIRLTVLVQIQISYYRLKMI